MNEDLHRNKRISCRANKIGVTNKFRISTFEEHL